MKEKNEKEEPIWLDEEVAEGALIIKLHDKINTKSSMVNQLKEQLARKYQRNEKRVNSIANLSARKAALVDSQLISVCSYHY